MRSQLFYCIMVPLFPVIYALISLNKLMAGQVDSGSMTYVLSTSTGRRKLYVHKWYFLLCQLV